ncbi:resolvase [Sphingomonas sp. CFBP 13714]|uniref:resolvase n=1 Tax=Sphingomonas sp. CFBP 13714 TaxID=2775308 RepID=UPI00177AE948|nr:resolvase [Sphingomonas sp. CFBP 13714]MBD8702111.1 resolvase [Sphingomonas sp. CFBP 13714]
MKLVRKQPRRRPIEADKVSAALKLAAASVPSAEVARQLGLGRSTIYQEMKRVSMARPA